MGVRRKPCGKKGSKVEGEREKRRERWDWWEREGQPIGTSDDFPGDG